ncbi:hypothetical protein ABZY05_25170 [Streptomyces canus]|uniref:hypothetical protein n=1 Tax=Streptomyces canus TaxID=58343 RepID=UPI0033B883FF
MENFTFSPANPEVGPGEVNRDSDAHTVTATDSDAFDCILHPNMTSTLIVR